ncbi:MAG TPA: dihydroxy-acid dehydratase [Candidatus Bariatricus faecipullorum]|nr:dihydroxy-acid dehydratase [Candidatus Bariatricus faecipullorum]
MKSYWNGPEAAHRRVMMKAAGYSDEDIRTKPHIGVPNSYMEGSPGSAHLRQIAEAVKQGIWEAGGVPVEFGIPATCGNIANGAEELKYEQVGRDIVAMSVEFVTRVHNFDGLVMIASCDNIIAGCYLAAARVDIPSMVVTGGSMQPGHYCGKAIVEADLDVARFSGASEEELYEMEEAVCPSFGACPSMGTANTMQMLGEVMNLVMPGTATVPASDNQKLRQARLAGKFAVELVKSGSKPSDLITKEVLENAIMFDMAVAGSTNAVLHILTMAYELGIPLTLEDFDRYAEEIPCINAVIPSGPYTVVDFHYAGGVPAVLKMLEGKLHKDVRMMNGATLGEYLDTVKAEPGDVIHSLENPLFHEPGLRVMRGNLSPNGAIVRPTGVPESVKYMKGKAKVFEGDRAAFEAIEAGKIVPGDILVIRYEGCKGAPGMKELMLSIDALIGHGLHTSVGLVSDARFSGFNYGAIVGHVSPEAYDGGVIALVEDGDEIIMDTREGELTLLVSDEELARRRENWVCPPLKEQKGCLNLFARNCRPAEEGGAMQPW